MASNTLRRRALNKTNRAIGNVLDLIDLLNELGDQAELLLLAETVHMDLSKIEDKLGEEQ